MRTALPIAIRAAFTFVAFMVIQYMIPYYILALVGLVAALFLYKTGDDRHLGVGVAVGSIAFGVYAFVIAQYFQ